MMFPELSVSEHEAKRLVAADDTEYQTSTVESVAVETVDDGARDMYEVRTTDSGVILVPFGPKNKDGSLVVRAPVAGDRLRFYGRGMGYPVRGIALVESTSHAAASGATFIAGLYRYATEEEEKALHAEMLAKQNDDRRRKWEESKMGVAADVNKLPEPFRKRFEFFMRNPNWGPEFGHYEVFAMKEAWKIYQAIAAKCSASRGGDVFTAIHEFSGMTWGEQKKVVPDLADNHSGNTFGAACTFAQAFAARAQDGEQAPELYQFHGALCPLVGCEKYGCYATTVASNTPTLSARRVQTTYTPEERTRMLQDMRTVSNLFYEQARRIGHHQFIEFAGFLNETIKIWMEMHEAGVDFGTTDLQAKPYQMAYIAEKFDCIFGEALTDDKNRAAFLTTLADKGGWKL